MIHLMNSLTGRGKLFWKYNWGFILGNIEKVEPPIENIPGKRFFFFV
jgi:hypothetical protein